MTVERDHALAALEQYDLALEHGASAVEVADRRASLAIYLGDAKLPDGESAENLDMARLHIDLLEVLKNKTAGNLTAQEHTLLEDLLYQLRLRYVQKRG